MKKVVRTSKLMKVKGKMQENRMKKVFNAVGKTVHDILFPKWTQYKPKRR